MSHFNERVIEQMKTDCHEYSSFERVMQCRHCKKKICTFNQHRIDDWRVGVCKEVPYLVPVNLVKLGKAEKHKVYNILCRLPYEYNPPNSEEYTYLTVISLNTPLTRNIFKHLHGYKWIAIKRSSIIELDIIGQEEECIVVHNDRMKFCPNAPSFITMLFMTCSDYCNEQFKFLNQPKTTQ